MNWNYHHNIITQNCSKEPVSIKLHLAIKLSWLYLFVENHYQITDVYYDLELQIICYKMHQQRTMGEGQTGAVSQQKQLLLYLLLSISVIHGLLLKQILI